MSQKLLHLKISHSSHSSSLPPSSAIVGPDGGDHLHSPPVKSPIMGCCSNQEEEEQRLHPLINPPQESPQLTTTTVTSSSAASGGDGELEPTHIAISPMNSNYSALLCQDTLRAIFQKLPLSDLARASCVCRLWSSVASDREIQTRAFKAPWKLKDVIGDPSSGSFWRDNSISKFAISHRLLRYDTVAGLAVKYSVQVMDIKRLNNMMSDHGIYSRERLLIPVSKPELLVNGICYIELDTYAKREVAVLYLEGGPDGKRHNMLNRLTTEQGKRRVLDSLRRSMQVDDGTAQYYLSISDGNPRAALTQFSEDLRWERDRGLA